ncbi:hypothetical protein P3TCK_04501 [Photobacterium profundum 3TCK]|uniref:Uncharacterized protein n=1 Tax=Photobacterium profundum 3TCK TaxID=314280 RepID=Q1ZA85_9GAMM|nr:hypothetical protein P3TCK_04501 [Photobacterium profundum 3TCK]
MALLAAQQVMIPKLINERGKHFMGIPNCSGEKVSNGRSVKVKCIHIHTECMDMCY